MENNEKELEIERIISTFPEPFRSTARLPRFSFDYRLNKGKDDHEYLRKRGYELSMGRDCAYYINGLANLNASSYGNWGTIWSDLFTEKETFGKYNKSFYEFCKMYEAGIVKLWRINFFRDGVEYIYCDDSDDETKWRKSERGVDYVECENPLEMIINNL